MKVAVKPKTKPKTKKAATKKKVTAKKKALSSGNKKLDSAIGAALRKGKPSK